MTPTEPAIDYAEAAMSHKAPTIVPVVAAKSHTEATTAYTEAITSHMHPFEPTLTSREKMEKIFLLERVQILEHT